MSDLQKQFETLARKYIKRDGIESLLASLAKSDFYTAPASTRFHHSFEGGLATHTIEVFHHLMNELYKRDEFTHESITILSLFHDLSKVGYYGTDMRNAKNEETGKWEKVPYYTVDDKFPMGHGEKSVVLVLGHMKLSPDEMLAIRWHMGLSVPKEEYGPMGDSYRQSPLGMYLHFADMKSTYLSEHK